MKKSLHIIITIFVFASVILSVTAYAEEIRFDASVSRNIVTLGHTIQLNLKFGRSKSIPAPELSDIDGFKVRYIGPSTSMSIVNGRMSSSVTHVYRLVPLKTGKFTIGPITFDHKNNTYISNPLTLQVVDSALNQPPAAHGKRQQTALKDRLFLTMKTGKSKIYINETIPLTIKLYVSGLSIRDIEYPQFSHDGFSAEQFGKHNQYQENKGGILYDVVEFKTSIFGTKAGEFTIGPATLSASLVMKNRRGRSGIFGDPFDDFFGRYEAEPVELSSDGIRLTVLPLPKANRPADFNGTVGDFTIDISVSPTVVRTGDPVILKSTVTGKGNFSTVTGPVITNSDNFKIYEPQSKQEGNRKTFEQILIPMSDSIKEVPETLFSYFDTSSGEYKTIKSGPFPITVTKPDKKEDLIIMDAPRTAEGAIIKETFGHDIIYIKESPGALKKKGVYLYQNPLFLLLQIIPLILLAAIISIKKRRDRLNADIGYARRLKAPRKAKKGIREAELHLGNNNMRDFYDTVFRTLREYIGNRFHLTTGGITVDDVERLLEGHNVDTSVTGKIQNIFAECDMARYAPSELGPGKREVTLKNLKEVIDHLERNK